MEETPDRWGPLAVRGERKETQNGPAHGDGPGKGKRLGRQGVWAAVEREKKEKEEMGRLG